MEVVVEEEERRTHKDSAKVQVKQVVREFERTCYRPKMVILGSRNQYCIHPTVSKSKEKNTDW